MSLHLSDSGCYGTCNQGRKPCTMPGVCGLRRVSVADLNARQAEREAAAAEAARIARLRITLEPDGMPPREVRPIPWASFRPLLIVGAISACATLWLAWQLVAAARGAL